jgi:hypothetical protein
MDTRRRGYQGRPLMVADDPATAAGSMIWMLRCVF